MPSADCNVLITTNILPQFQFDCYPFLTPTDASWIYFVVYPMMFIAAALMVFPIFAMIRTVFLALFCCKNSERESLQANRMMLVIIAAMLVCGFLASTSFSLIAMDMKDQLLSLVILDQRDLSLHYFIRILEEILWPGSLLVTVYSFSLQILFGFTAVFSIFAVTLLYRRKKQVSITFTDEETGKTKQENIRKRGPLPFYVKILLFLLLFLLAHCTISSMFGGMSLQRLCAKTPEIMTSPWPQKFDLPNYQAYPYFLEAAYYGYVQPSSIKGSIFYQEYIRLFEETRQLAQELGINQSFQSVKDSLVLCNGTWYFGDIFKTASYSSGISRLSSDVSHLRSDYSTVQSATFVQRKPQESTLDQTKAKMLQTLRKLEEVMDMSNCERINSFWQTNWNARVCSYGQNSLLVLCACCLVLYSLFLAVAAPGLEKGVWMLFWITSCFLIITTLSWSAFIN